MATTAIGRIGEAADCPLWYQLYVVKDKSANREMIGRAVAAGCSAVVVTVDAPLLGRRRRDEKNRFALPPGLAIENLSGLDVLKALALGARPVLLGRPILWGLAIAGAEGVYEVLEGFRTELDRALALCGCRTPGEVTPEHVRGPAASPERC